MNSMLYRLAAILATFTVSAAAHAIALRELRHAMGLVAAHSLTPKYRYRTIGRENRRGPPLLSITRGP